MQTPETERLILRPRHESGLEDFYACGKGPEAGPNAGWKPHGSRQESAGFVETELPKTEGL